jgi:hypothetical protein
MSPIMLRQLVAAVKYKAIVTTFSLNPACTQCLYCATGFITCITILEQVEEEMAAGLRQESVRSRPRLLRVDGREGRESAN